MRSPCILLRLMIAGVVLGSEAGARAADEPAAKPAQSVAGENPYTSERDFKTGRLMVRAYCSGCHGPEGKGGRGANLTKAVFRNGNTDQAIFNNIRDGISGTDMPAFPADDETLWQTVAYIRSIQQRNPETPPPGDPHAGAKLFEKHNCTNCHWTGTDGGRRAPDLSALMGPAEYIRTSILDPDANFRQEVAFQHEPYQRILVVTSQGQMLEGRWLNENAYFVQFMDGQEMLQTVPRDAIDHVAKPKQSLMPQFGALLSKDELTHLVAYVFSLRPEIENTGE